ncbi:LapA family protein [Candidatus Parcubacteria bacterium]|nr:MAG: LapA family protein [Candidatus Parcubacteria bacterium]
MGSYILGIVIGASLVSFALQNTADATVAFVGWTLSLPLALLVTGALTLGALGTIIAMIPGFIKNERYIKKLEADKKSRGR